MLFLISTFLYSSDEDIDVGALVKSWLKGQPEDCRSSLENWLGDYFQRALDWVLKQVTFTLYCILTLTQTNNADTVLLCSNVLCVNQKWTFLWP